MTLDAAERFASVINAEIPSHKALPLIHITDAYSFVDILGPNTVSPVDCPVFKKPLTYMFYGRPSYPTKHKGSNLVQANLPVALIFDPIKLSSLISEVYPFDTGAFYGGLYSSFFHKNTDSSHFLLKEGLQSAGKIVSYFYRSNEEYFHGGTRKNIDIPFLNFEIEGVLELARLNAGYQSDGSFSPDIRSSSIELIIDQTIDISESLIGIIIPQVFLDHPTTREYIANLKVSHIQTYNSVNNTPSPFLTGMLFEKVHAIYRAEGILS